MIHLNPHRLTLPWQLRMKTFDLPWSMHPLKMYLWFRCMYVSRRFYSSCILCFFFSCHTRLRHYPISHAPPRLWRRYRVERVNDLCRGLFLRQTFPLLQRWCMLIEGNIEHDSPYHLFLSKSLVGDDILSLSSAERCSRYFSLTLFHASVKHL